jgi:alkaline phosphatase D
MRYLLQWLTTGVRYINTGNSKFGALTIESLEDGDRSSLHYSLYVDGVEAWNTVILTPDVPEGMRPPTSLWDRILGMV